MIKDIRYFVIAISIFLLLIILNLPFPNEYPLIEHVLINLNLPTRVGTGIYVSGLISICLLLFSLYFISKGLKRFHFIAFVIMFVLVGWLPPAAVESYQKTVASGIDAVVFNHNESECHIELIDDTTLNGQCKLSLQNFGKEDIELSLLLDDRYSNGAPITIASLINEAGPFSIKLKGQQDEVFFIDININAADRDYIVGRSDMVNIVIEVDGGQRWL
ncbi:hypothetical protein [Cytobacillus purgationiresistens]|uniref:Uncharacterized protein n=1 Tax=Cytobacillus purgationiresistens TaxID=863449 RepID=A0ABU0ANB7_9BACI|nr:hypothetical protein [Cytobacillus purgationiresistens]MDQ0272776.1 hypothetical protein [Cytobacillus purgationiresistens]